MSGRRNKGQQRGGNRTGRANSSVDLHSLATIWQPIFEGKIDILREGESCAKCSMVGTGTDDNELTLLLRGGEHGDTALYTKKRSMEIRSYRVNSNEPASRSLD